MKYLLCLVISAFVWIPSFAQSPDTLFRQARVFQLGEISVFGSPIDSISTVSIRKIEKFNRVDLSNSLNLLSGITLASVGPRNESVVYVRGFDLRQVPVFMDGVPVYVPYDGYVDLGRFTPFDLAQINVSKGFASILYGANTMGGAINLVSRRPSEKLELDARVGVFSGQGFRWNLNAGSNLGKVFFQVGISQLKQDSYPMSEDFEPRRYEDGGDRENSYRNDFKFSAKVGFTPNDKDEYVFGYSNQQGEKGNPPYVGDDSRINTRFWQWPEWNKQSLYFISTTAVGQETKLKTRLFYDTFDNALFSYDDSTFSAQNRPFAFQSFYDDFTLGGNAELDSRISSKNNLKLGVQYKYDVHRENNLNEPQRTFVDNMLSIGLENTYQILPALALVPGISFNSRFSTEAQDYNSSNQEITDFPANDNSAVNAQLGVFWDINPENSLKGSISRKTRFATIKDRYSYRMGQAIPNPDLTAEVAVNYDLTYSGKWFDKLTVNSSLFRSDISDIIQQVDNVEPDRFQLQNAGEALFYGAELGLDYSLGKNFHLGTHYTFTRRKNETNPEILFTQVPEHKIFGYLDYLFAKRVNLLLSPEYNSERNSTSYGTKAAGYILLNTKAAIKITKNLQLEGGVNNMLDKNYSLVEGFPEVGRNCFLNLSYTY